MLIDSDIAAIYSRQGPLSGVPIARQLTLPRIRLAYRWLRFAVRSTLRGDWDFVANGLRASLALPLLFAGDVLRKSRIRCPICLWQGHRFYPNVGPGYDERDSLCPGCGGLPRQRDLLIVLAFSGLLRKTSRIVEVAPMRGFERMLQQIAATNYTSFDLERNAMVKGDITCMPFADGEVDLFLCFHVLEHIPRVDMALAEIHRVLSRTGVAVIQVPVDWTLDESYEYGRPDPRDVGHVRKYGADVRQRIGEGRFHIRDARSSDYVGGTHSSTLGLSTEPILLASRTDSALP